MTGARMLVLLGALALTIAHRPGPAWAVKCLDDAGDAAQVAAARTAVDAACKCFDIPSHGAYVRCAVGVVNDRVETSLLRKECKSTVRKIYALSVCGNDLARIGTTKVRFFIPPLLGRSHPTPSPARDPR